MRPTKKHLEVYKKWVKKWLNDFKVGGWDIYFELDYKDRENLAGSKWNLNGRSVTFELNNGWGGINPLTEVNIKESALHEVLHLIMAELTTIGSRRYINKDQLEKAQEEAVNTLLNYILKKNVAK